MKTSMIDAISNRWPLIEQRMSRSDCLAWMERNGFARPPRSACTFCPFRSNEEWRHLRDHEPEGWKEAIEVDAAIRRGLTTRGLDGALYVHAKRVPLPFVDIDLDVDQFDMFGNECEGMCGV